MPSIETRTRYGSRIGREDDVIDEIPVVGGYLVKEAPDVNGLMTLSSINGNGRPDWQ